MSNLSSISPSKGIPKTLILAVCFSTVLEQQTGEESVKNTTIPSHTLQCLFSMPYKLGMGMELEKQLT